MNEIVTILMLTLMAGLAIPLGALLSVGDHIKSNWLETEFRHSVMAFGGGALLSAVALVLVPEGSRNLGVVAISFWFMAGGIAFMALDIFLHRLNTSMAQLVAMLSDFVPEALALGAALSLGNSSAFLLALLMALQNLPEGFNSFRELKSATTFSNGRLLGVFVLLALLGPVCGFAGYYWLSAYPVAVSCVMIFSAGGILYITFTDIAPQAKLENHWLPAIGVVAGFLLGLIGHQFLVN